ncbi:hypothetical protein AGABI1DRAFT_130367 [Agaricus bisporus var. burnettii JB137-S8]|uniref:WW domain-containing protein n=1 Tax=Agaricus bisporus var. burnettii (strain JB137-S8 / ATCC MYA-4627 / FGSC 10392) TaxID=597362 RepID=K5VS39_AGABU|nr:uncharacterized protein AGABI1DRAFT_130367 [Agaricus bisporus var. burnettii JB137-S8]EKM77279.1 hypothetical protein AGABI1DRAFT_130367 [Agaricus bisporus var. burnettii JB137-S8]
MPLQGGMAVGNTVCCSTFPSDPSSTHVALKCEDLRETTLVASPLSENTNWFGDERKAIIHSPRKAPGALTEEEEEGFMVKKYFNEVEDAPELSQVVEGLYPVSVDDSERYERRVTIPKGSSDDFLIPFPMEPCTQSIPPSPWVRCVHPEGAVYFWDSGRRIVTDADILNDAVCGLVENRLKMIQDYIVKYDIVSARLMHVHLYLEHYPKTSSFGYYFVDHIKQTLFWLDTKYGHPIVKELQTPSPSLRHVGFELRSQYWFHNEYFPHLLCLSNETLSELQDTLWHAVGDLLTSSGSTYPFTLAETKDMQRLVAEFVSHHRESSSGCGSGYHRGGSSLSNGIDVGARTIVCRFLGILLHHRFLNFHGEMHARLNRDQSVFQKTKRTWFMSLVSPLLLYAPETYLQNIQSLAVDGLVDKPSWNRLTSNLTEEWKESILYATVLLTSNVSFLAIQSLDDSGSVGYRCPAQRVSYLSIALSIGAVVLGLSLSRQYRTTLKRDFFANRSATALGFETLAIMHSLPHTLLVCAMVTFFLAFSIMCYQSRDKVAIAILTAAWVTTVLFLLWCISMSYESTLYEAFVWPSRKFNELKHLIGEKLKSRSTIKEHVSEEASV